MSYAQEFLADARTFANQHTLYPFADPVVNQAHMAKKTLTDGSEIQQVQGENKVAFCKIVGPGGFQRLKGDLGNDYKQDQDLLVMRITYEKSSDSFPVYYLPWQRNALIRVKLKPSPHHPAQKGIIFKETIEPQVFVTAALQGCSIIVSGDPQEPIVYHINASSTTGPMGETLNTDSDATFVAAAGAKVTKMQTLYTDARSQFPKEGSKGAAGARPPQTFTSKSATLTEYSPGNLPTGQTRLLRRYHDKFTNVRGLQFGTVFGIKGASGWVFYRQSRTRLWDASDMNLGKWVDPVCLPFWP